MAKLSTLGDWVASVRVYGDGDARPRDQFGRASMDEIKPVHDRLFQAAIDLKLASTLVLMDAKYLPKEFRARLNVMVARPQWWPSNRALNNRNDLLGAPLAAFDRSWRVIRACAEPKRRPVHLWESDPALVFEALPGRFLGRTASIGHEAEILYFVYGGESEWEGELKRHGMVFWGGGEARYKLSFGVPGEVGGV